MSNLERFIVLVYEEHRPIQRLIECNLKKRGYIVVITDQIAGFGEMASEHEPSLLLIELSFSKSADWVMLGALADDPALMHRPAILLTSLSRDDMHYVGALPPNVVATVIKPIVPEVLLEVMREVMNGHAPVY